MTQPGEFPPVPDNNNVRWEDLIDTPSEPGSLADQAPLGEDTDRIRPGFDWRHDVSLGEPIPQVHLDEPEWAIRDTAEVPLVWHRPADTYTPDVRSSFEDAEPSPELETIDALLHQADVPVVRRSNTGRTAHADERPTVFELKESAQEFIDSLRTNDEGEFVGEDGVVLPRGDMERIRSQADLSIHLLNNEDLDRLAKNQALNAIKLRVASSIWRDLNAEEATVLAEDAAWIEKRFGLDLALPAEATPDDIERMLDKRNQIMGLGGQMRRAFEARGENVGNIIAERDERWHEADLRDETAEDYIVSREEPAAAPDPEVVRKKLRHRLFRALGATAAGLAGGYDITMAGATAEGLEIAAEPHRIIPQFRRGGRVAAGDRPTRHRRGFSFRNERLDGEEPEEQAEAHPTNAPIDAEGNELVGGRFSRGKHRRSRRVGTATEEPQSGAEGSRPAKYRGKRRVGTPRTNKEELSQGTEVDLRPEPASHKRPDEHRGHRRAPRMPLRERLTQLRARQRKNAEAVANAIDGEPATMTGR